MRWSGVLGLLGLVGCGGGGAKEAGPETGGAAAETGTAAGPTLAGCQAWLGARPTGTTAAGCDTDVGDAVERLAAAGAGRITLASGRSAVAWFPADWDGREPQSVLVLLHGTVGCAEGSAADFLRLLPDDHALVALGYENADGSYATASEIQRDLDETVAALAGVCPVADAAWLMYGVSRGAARTVQLAGLDRAGPQRFAGFAVDSGTLPPADYNGSDFTGAHLWLWCGAFDPDPRGVDTTTCAFMAESMVPTLTRAGATIDAFVQGEASCHGLFQWDCEPGCESCAGQARPEAPGPHLTALQAWLQERAGAG